MSTVQEIAVDETYHDVEKMLWKLSGGYQNKFGGDRHDYDAAADDGFIRAYETYDPEKAAAFSTWCYCIARNNIRKMLNERSKRQKQFAEFDDVDFDAENVSPLIERSNFDLEAFWRMASDDAKLVVKSVLDSPIEVMDAMIDNGLGATIRSGIRSHLRRLGWSVYRIAKTFNEVREVLR